MVTTLLSFIFVLGILVFIHELGHFLVAKWVGIRVDRFSVGFPPNIFARKWRGTEYAIGIIPLGGYVKMAGENPDEEASGAPDEFMSKSVPARAAVIFAGPFMNYILAIVILIGIFLFAGTPIFDSERIVVGAVSDDGPALDAGLLEGDQIVALDGLPVTNFDSLRMYVNARVEEPIAVTFLRGTDSQTVTITTKAQPALTPEGDVDTVGILGVNQQPVGYERYGFGEAVARGVGATHLIVTETVRFLGKLVTGQMSSSMIGGPLFIAQQSGREARKGAQSLFFFMALLSVNLAILNILPIPVLDGGHLIFLAIEAIKGSPLSMKARLWAQQVGMVLLLGLIVYVTYNDILRFFRGI